MINLKQTVIGGLLIMTAGCGLDLEKLQDQTLFAGTVSTQEDEATGEESATVAFDLNTPNDLGWKEPSPPKEEDPTPEPISPPEYGFNVNIMCADDAYTTNDYPTRSRFLSIELRSEEGGQVHHLEYNCYGKARLEVNGLRVNRQYELAFHLEGATTYTGSTGWFNASEDTHLEVLMRKVAGGEANVTVDMQFEGNNNDTPAVIRCWFNDRSSENACTVELLSHGISATAICRQDDHRERGMCEIEVKELGVYLVADTCGGSMEKVEIYKPGQIVDVKLQGCFIGYDPERPDEDDDSSTDSADQGDSSADSPDQSDSSADRVDQEDNMAEAPRNDEEAIEAPKN